MAADPAAELRVECEPGRPDAAADGTGGRHVPGGARSPGEADRPTRDYQGIRPGEILAPGWRALDESFGCKAGLQNALNARPKTARSAIGALSADIFASAGMRPITEAPRQINTLSIRRPEHSPLPGQSLAATMSPALEKVGLDWATVPGASENRCEPRQEGGSIRRWHPTAGPSAGGELEVYELFRPGAEARSARETRSRSTSKTGSLEHQHRTSRRAYWINQ